MNEQEKYLFELGEKKGIVSGFFIGFMFGIIIIIINLNV